MTLRQAVRCANDTGMQYHRIPKVARGEPEKGSAIRPGWNSREMLLSDLCAPGARWRGQHRLATLPAFLPWAEIPGNRRVCWQRKGAVQLPLTLLLGCF